MPVREPKSHVVMGQILELIEQAEPGAHLPTERQLAARFQTSRTTVRQALAALAANGRVARTQGSGTVVAVPDLLYVRQLTSYSEDLRAQGHTASGLIRELEYEPAGAEAAAALGLAPTDRVTRVDRVRIVNGEPLALEVARLPGELSGLRQHLVSRESLYAVLAAEYGIHPARSQDVVATALASPAEAEALHIEVGAALLSIQRTAYDASGLPVEFTRSAFRGDRFRFVADSSF